MALARPLLIPESISRLRVPDERELAPELRELVTAHDADNSLRVLALNPGTLRRFASYFRDLFDPQRGVLPLRERELIAVVVSRENGCAISELRHTLALGEALGDSARARRIAVDPQLVGLSGRERALAELAVKITRAPRDVRCHDLEALRMRGFSEAEVLEAVETITWFNHANRLLTALGVVPDAKYFGS